VVVFYAKNYIFGVQTIIHSSFSQYKPHREQI